jgi:hypothetical protein
MLFRKDVEGRICPQEMEVLGLSGFFVPRSKNHCCLTPYCCATPFFLVWGQVGEVWAHCCRWCRRELNLATHHPFFLCFPLSPPYWNLHRQSISRTVVRADSDEYAAQLDKMQKEAEARLDDKVDELMKNIETVGQSN